MTDRILDLAQFIVSVLDKDANVELCHFDTHRLDYVNIDGRIDLVILASRIDAWMTGESGHLTPHEIAHVCRRRG